MSDNTLNKNTLLEASFGSKDTNTVEGMQIDKVTKSQIISMVQNIYSNPGVLEVVLNHIITRIENLEKNSTINNSTNTSVKKNKYRNFVPLKLSTVNIHPEISKIIEDYNNNPKNFTKIKIDCNPDVLNKYTYESYTKIIAGGPAIRTSNVPKCIIFVHKDYYSQFQNLIKDIKDFKYYE